MNNQQSRHEGTVKFFNESKGYGFIARDDGKGDVFVHVNQLGDVGGTLSEGQKVSFEVEQGQKGLQATQVQGE